MRTTITALVFAAYTGNVAAAPLYTDGPTVVMTYADKAFKTKVTNVKDTTTFKLTFGAAVSETVDTAWMEAKTSPTVIAYNKDVANSDATIYTVIADGTKGTDGKDDY